MKLLKMNLSVAWHQSWMDSAALAEPKVLSRPDYYALMDLPREYQSGPLTSPWPPDKGQGFWERYLDHWRRLDAVKKEPAWRALVPLRSGVAPLQITADGTDTRTSTEGFLHPWGGTFMVHLKLTGEWQDLASAANRVGELRREECFTVEGDEAGRHRLDGLAARGLDALRALAVEASAGPISEGFSVFAVLDAAGAIGEFDPAVDATGAARFLHAVTSFSPNWEQETSRPPAEAKVAGKATDPPSHVVYGSPRARAIWSPALFTISKVDHVLKWGEDKRRITVGCHHRNLTLASMQTEALSRFASETADRLAAGTALGNEHDLLARCAVGRLGSLYEASPKTYRSRSLPAQIDDGGFLDAINTVRVAREMPPIAP